MLDMFYGKVRRVVRLAPKNHAKTTWFSHVLPLWLTAVNPDLRIIVASVNSDLAERFQRVNRRELERNEDLIQAFGDFKPVIPEKWTQSELIVNRQIKSPSPTWRAVGSEGAVQGGRADWIIGDDIADIENSTTTLQRDKLDLWVDSDLLGTLEPDGRVLLIGTAKHNDDVYHRRERRAQEDASSWDFKRDDALVDEAAKQTIWPTRWTWDALMEKKSAIGSLAFNRDYRNVAVNEETSLFPLALLRRALRPDLVMLTTYDGPDSIVAGVDYGIVESEREAQASDRDFTVLQNWQLLPGKRFRLTWMLRYRGKGFTEQAQILTSTLQRFSTLRIAISEANQAQRWMSSEILRTSIGSLPIFPHVTTKKAHVDLFEGIPSLSALFEAGAIELPYGDAYSKSMVDVFIQELHGLSVEAHDDTVMAFYLASVGFRKLSGGVSWGVLKTRT